MKCYLLENGKLPFLQELDELVADIVQAIEEYYSSIVIYGGINKYGDAFDDFAGYSGHQTNGTDFFRFPEYSVA